MARKKSRSKSTKAASSQKVSVSPATPAKKTKRTSSGQRGAAPVVVSIQDKKTKATKPPKVATSVIQESTSKPKERLSITERIARLTNGRRFGIIFAIFSVSVLLITTLFWSVLSARLQEANADQFIDAYLFENGATFQGALFPGAHTFLLKWPLFALMQIYGYQTFVYLVATVVLVLITLGVLVSLMYRLTQRRPLLFGVLCLALSSVLLLIPAQPYPGALLPVNLAMTTTRNLEYAVLIWCLYRFMIIRNLRQPAFWVLTVLLAVVVASDKLFAVLLVGSAVGLLAGCALLARQKIEVIRAGRLFLMAILAFALANIALFAISHSGLTHIVDEATTSPYPVVHSLRQVVLGLVFGISAIATNLGANPVHDVVIVRDLPRQLLQSLTRPTTAAYVLNGLILLVGLFAVVRVALRRPLDRAARFTVALSGATLAALAVFILTDHYYPVDARYLAIELFTVFIALAAYFGARQSRTRHILAIGLIITIILPLGVYQSWHEYHAGEAALAAQNKLTRTVATIMDRSHIRKLMGDYWQITPVKSRTVSAVTVAPTDSCNQPRQVLTSEAWYAMPKSTPTAVLATRDPGKQTYNGCSLAKLATLYGTPSERVALEREKQPPYTPQQLLLVYDQGIQPLKPKAAQAVAAAPPAPPTVSGLRDRTTCDGTSMNVVAHQDDDLLFMNPDVFNDIKANRCIRTVYMTAGDAGEAPEYWRSRELGAQAAYAAMYGVADSWHQQRQMVAGRYVTVSTLDAMPRVELVFMHLPDGNMQGGGFPATHNESLGQLFSEAIPTIHAVDDNAAYTKQELLAILQGIMAADRPDTIRSQGSHDAADGDHSDHHAVGDFTVLAQQAYASGPATLLYIGYPGKLQPVNLSDDDVTLKQQTFLDYAKFDGAVCQTALDCQQTYTYGRYLTRQYRVDNAAAGQ